MPVLQCTLSGIDVSGFAWSNVFHIQADLGPGTFYDLLVAINNLNAGAFLTAYEDAATDGTKFLDIAAKGVGADASYTLHKRLASAGTRAITEAVGALCPLIRFLPAAGTILGGLYAVGAGVIDFVGDTIQPAYQGLLQDVADALLAYDGTAAPYHPQLVTYNPHGPVITKMVHREPPTRATTLNKRMRA